MMSIVMSTMAKQQNPGAFKLNAICEKLKKTSEEGGDDDEMNEFELIGDNNNSGSGGFYADRFCQNGNSDVALRSEQCPTPQSTSSVMYNEDSNSNPEYYGESTEYLNSEDPGSPVMDGDAQELNLDANVSRTSFSEGGGGGSSRKNKRKNFKPRNIVYQYEPCEDVADNEFVAEYPASSEPETMLVTKANSFQDSTRELDRHLDQYSQEDASKEAEPMSSLEEEPLGQDHEQPLDLSGDPGAGGTIAKQTLLPRRIDGAGTPIDLSFRNMDTSSDNSCTSSEDGHNGFAIDLSKGSDGWGAKDCVSLAEMESSSSCSDCPLATTSCYSACDGIPLSSVPSVSMASSGHGPLVSSPSPVGAASRESPTSSSRSALGTGDSSPGRVSPMLLPPTLTAITTSCSSSSITTPTSTDANTMKDYAESTMKELLSLYGLNDMAESITKNVPLDNFSSGKILETMSPRMMMSFSTATTSTPSGGGMAPPTPPVQGTAASNCQRSPSPLPVSSTPSTPVLNNQSSPSVTMHYPTPSSSSSRGAAATTTTTNDGAVYNSLCNKVVDSMAKLASLPPNSIIGNPRVILPPNMTSTILTLAAMQESKYAAAAMAAVSSNPSPKPPTLEPMTSHPIVKPQPSVIVSSSSFGGSLATKEHMSKAVPIDYTRYVRRFSNATECGSNYCKDLNYREHFHCMDCNSRVFIKKEEMIRHFKWHKKRDESLQHGFLRFSPMDDCSDKFPGCSHNRKQTHYHCLKDGCDKVYISTSDVQMHANYHRKDSAIIQEGFQRYRATEDCGIISCSFYGQRTTHFHCRRSNCNYTFKNKADMEKHKTYHIKDEQLNKDGFKKFMKHEHCSFESCRFSRVCNHIHCIRAGCSYVLHSSGQLYSHKRKHERGEKEMAYRKFKLAQSMLKTFSEYNAYGFPAGQLADEGNSSESTSSGVHTSNAIPVIQSTVNATATSSGGGPMQSMAGTLPSNPPVVSFSNHHQNPSYPSIDSHSLNQLANIFTAGVNLNTFGLPVPFIPTSGSKTVDHLLSGGPLSTVAAIPTPEHLAAIDLSNDLLKPKPDDSWKRYLSRYTANDPCKPNCDFLYKDHYHCTTDNCVMIFRSKDGVREHARTHEQQEQVTEAFFTTVEVGQMHLCPNDCPYQSKEKHYHCCWESCREIILPTDKPFRRLDHYKMHDYSRKSNAGKDHLNMTTSLDGMFKRKRGRPPKNRIIEFPVSSNPSDLPQAIFTSFKLPKPNPLALNPPIPCTTAAQHGAPISAVATPFGLLPAALLPQSIVSTPSVTSIATTALPMTLASHISPSIKPKAITDFGRLQTHIQKHVSPSSSESPSAEANEQHGNPADEELTEGGDDDDQADEPEEAEENDNASSHNSHAAPAISTASDSLKTAPPSLFTSAIPDAAPLYFSHVRNLASVAGYHNMLPAGAQPMAANIEKGSSPCQNGVNELDKAEQPSQEMSAFMGGLVSPFREDSAESNPNSPRWLSGSRKRNPSPRCDEYGDMKRPRVPSSISSLRILKDEPVPDGYIRYRFNEDCHYQHCGYREHQTHFHCIRRDCGYSFCDKTRFVQHTARHERLDTLMGGDFQQFRANVACGRPDCLYTITMSTTGTSGNKASHFHCLKCDFVCTDTNKVVAHRRQHQKLDSIMAAGFEKFTPAQNCNIEGCTHNQKQTHYHCMKCQYAVLGLSQMSAHKYRHLE